MTALPLFEMGVFNNAVEEVFVGIFMETCTAR